MEIRFLLEFFEWFFLVVHVVTTMIHHKKEKTMLESIENLEHRLKTLESKLLSK